MERAFTTTGNLVLSHKLYAAESNARYAIKLPAYIASGSYTVKIINSSGKVIGTIPLIIGK